MQQQFEDALTYLDANDRWALDISDPGRDNLFAGQVYLRGAAALHALRLEIGDKSLFAGSQLWLTTYNESTATTEDFEAVMEQASGQQLDTFFDEWLRGDVRPGVS
ncbi:aminopeptidase N [Arthrobacter ginsengisoli]|uniref:Aminopeptidase N n=1 Tax=Arthrobacter ginsengisoli TaxID=1356565 RepID=A0ABU1U753_9MICC|nr:aminopeptidase N [Arthrobacter ginsengisoli]